MYLSIQYRLSWLASGSVFAVGYFTLFRRLTLELGQFRGMPVSP